MKFRVKDEDGRDYVVEELVEEEVIPPEVVEDDDNATDEALSADEIKALRELLAHGPELLALLKDEHEEHAEDEEIDEEEKEEIEDEDEDDIVEDEDIDEEKEEEILETKSHDSKKAFGSIEKSKKACVDDSLTDNVSDAWAKRYNGGIK